MMMLKRKKIMKKISIALIRLTMVFTLLTVSIPGYAAVTNKVVLQIEGMT
jgi:hypothetical protein